MFFFLFILCFIIITIFWNRLILLTLNLRATNLKRLSFCTKGLNYLLALSSSFLAFIFSLLSSLDSKKLFFFLLNSSFVSGNWLSFKYFKIDFIFSSVDLVGYSLTYTLSLSILLIWAGAISSLSISAISYTQLNPFLYEISG